MGCGCGLLAAIGISMIFIILGFNVIQEKRNPIWDRAAYAQCQDNLCYLREAIDSYQRDYHHLPPDLNALRGSYLDRPSRLRCPLKIRELGTAYEYHPEAVRPTDPFIICHNHGQGQLVLLRNGKVLLPNIFDAHKMVKRKAGK